MSAAPRRQGAVQGSIVTLAAEGLAIPAGVLIAGTLTRFLGPAEYGRYTVVATSLAIAEWLLIAVFARAIVRLVAESDDWEGAAATAFRAYVVVGLVVGAGFWLLADSFAALLRDPGLAPYLRMFAPQVPLFAAGAACRNVLAGLGRFREQALVSTVAWIGRAAGVAGLVALGWGIRGAIIGSITGTGLATLVALIATGGAVFRAPTLPLSRLAHLAVPVFLSMVAVRLFDQSGLYALKIAAAGDAAVGFYGAAMNVFMVTTVIGAGMTPVLISSLSAASGRNEPGRQEQIVQAATRFAWVLLPSAAIAAGSATELSVLLFGSDFAETGPLMGTLILAACIRATISIFSALLIGLDRAWIAATLAVPMPVAAFAFHMRVVATGGATAVAQTTLALAATAAIAFLVAVLTTARVPLPTATAARSVLAAVAGYAAAAAIPAAGVWVLAEIGVLLAAIAILALWLGEIDLAELAPSSGPGRGAT